MTRTLGLALTLVAAAGPAVGTDGGEARAGTSVVWSVEVKGHYRSSHPARFPVPFPFPPSLLPPGAAQGAMTTVEPGDHLELSVLTFALDATWSDRFAARLKVDGIDRYDRNPTSSDRPFDLDEAWLLIGRKTEPGLLPDCRGRYLQLGKLPKPERQDDRHLESYGLAATAFNRFEDVGIEAGFDLHRRVYLIASVSRGNPLFLRDPNALAGDNGTPELRRSPPAPELGSGVTVPYDADVDDLDFSSPELGLALGVRAGDRAGRHGVDLLFWGYRRELEESVDLHGTFYGGDLDLLRGPENSFPFPLRGDNKRELGVNLWWYTGGFSLFAQGVSQKVAGLDRDGWEVEVAHSFELPLRWAAGGRQLFPWIAPAARWSRLEPRFAAPAVTPSPSFAWVWEKVDLGVAVGIWGGLDLTVEVADNDFVLASGATRSEDELLATVRWRWRGRSGDGP